MRSWTVFSWKWIRLMARQVNARTISTDITRGVLTRHLDFTRASPVINRCGTSWLKLSEVTRMFCHRSRLRFEITQATLSTKANLFTILRAVPVWALGCTRDGDSWIAPCLRLDVHMFDTTAIYYITLFCLSPCVFAHCHVFRKLRN